MISSKYVNIAKEKMYFFDNNYEFDHRSAAILFYCEVEELLTEILEKFFSAIHDARPDKDIVSLRKMKSDLFDANRGTIGGLYKLNRIAMYLNLISYNLYVDIDKLIKLRNKYAHKKSAGQLSTDTDLFKFLTDTALYKQYHESLGDCTEQGVFLAFNQYLIDELHRIAEKDV